MKGDAIILRRFFSYKKKFYDIEWANNSNKKIDNELMQDLLKAGILHPETKNDCWDWSFFAKKIEENKKCRIFLVNVYCFAQLGGFAALKEVFAQEVKPNNIKNFCRALKVISYISEFLFKEQWEQGILPVCLASLRNFEQLSNNNDYKINKPNDLHKHLKLLEKLFSTDSSSYSHEICNISELNIKYSMQLLKSPLFDCRIDGIKEIINTIKNLKRKWPYRNPEDLDEKKAEKLSQFLKKEGIFIYMFGESNVHSELVKCCADGDVFSFLYCRNSLPKEEIFQLYNRAVSKTEDCTIQRYANIALISLIIHFSASSAKEILTNIMNIPLKDYTNFTVQILNSLGKNELERCSQANTKNENSEFILQDLSGETDIGVQKYIFSICFESALQKGLPTQVQNTLIDNFLTLLTEYRSRLNINPQYYYLKATEKMIINGESVLQSGKIYNKIINSLIKGKYAVEIEDADFFWKIVENINKRIQSKSYNVQEVQLQVDILQTLVLNKLNKKLLPQELELLWKVFIKNNDSESIRNIFFSFINQILTSKIVTEILAEGALNEFFSKCILSLEPQYYSQSAFTCFKTLFLLINLNEKNLKNEIEVIITTSQEIIGIEFLWEIILWTSYISAQKEASEFLINLHKNLSKEMIKKCGTEMKEKYVCTCIKNIKNSIKRIKDKDTHSLELISSILRSVELIEKYITMENMKLIESQNQSGGSTEIVGDQVLLIIRIYIGYRENWTEFSYPSSNTQQDLFNRIYSDSRASSVDDLKIVLNGKEFKPTMKPLKYSGFGSKLDNFVSLRSENREDPMIIKPEMINSVRDKIPGHEEEIYIAALKKAYNKIEKAIEYLTDELPTIKEEAEQLKKAQYMNEAAKEEDKLYKEKVEKISNIFLKHEEFYEQLFECFTLKVYTVEDNVWNLLSKLSISVLMHHKIVDILDPKSQIPQWPIILPSHSPYMLSYSLRILQSIISGTGVESNLPNFINKEGLKHLIYLLNNMPIVEIFTQTSSAQYMNNLINTLDTIIGMLFELAMRTLESIGQESLQTFLQLIQIENTTSVTNQKDILKLPKELDIEILQELKKSLVNEEVVQTLVKLFDILSNTKFYRDSCLKILENVLILLGAILNVHIEFYRPFYEDNYFFNCLSSVLLNSKSSNLKSLVTNVLRIMFNTFKPNNALLPLNMQFTKILLNNLPDPIKEYPDSEKYFEFLFELLQSIQSNSSDVVIFSLCNRKDLVKQLFSSIVYKIETANTRSAKDDIPLTGYFHLLTELIKSDPRIIQEIAELEKNMQKDFVEIVSNEMFGVPSKSSQANRRIKSRNVMRQVYLLLFEICKKSEKTLMFSLLEKMEKFHEIQATAAEKETQFLGGSRDDSSFNYVGLKNMGCTCFMNALLQQLFMMPEFRTALIAMNLKDIPDEKTEHTTKNLQAMFSYLLCSCQQYFIPIQFCRDFIWSDHKPMRLGIQQDSNEFFNLITEKLEKELMLINKGSFVFDFMAINQIVEIQSNDGEHPYYSPKNEKSLTLNLNIKNKKSIEEALDSLFKPEIIDCYECDLYPKIKMQISKGNLIQSLSNTVILHLERFEYNYDTQNKQKINDSCSFPMKINFSKWMKSPIVGEEDKYDYELVGVVVHSGSADGGHYYSIIKERLKTSPQYGLWLEFNDSTVSHYNESKLESTCFGTQVNSINQQSESYGTSAYMLFYEKINKKNLEQDARNLVSEEVKANISQGNLYSINAAIVLYIYINNF